jgi:beta-lactam-binding protein with PASTA domain
MVFAQSPPSGQEINKNSQVDLTVSKGTELITVPDVRGMDYVSARLSIESLGLSTLAMKFTDVNVKPGTVLAAEPSEGSAVIANTLVKLYVATGEHLIIVPDLENMDAASAGQILSDLGINFDQIFIKVDYSIQKNTVISQIPESGDQISVDDRLLLFIGQ